MQKKFLTIVTIMILGSLPFALYLRAVRGNLMPLFRDSQVRWFLSIVAVAVVAMTFYVWRNIEATSLEQAVRLSTFNIVSIITGTGYVTTNYSAWGSFPVGAFFFLMFIGGCAGSTSCGIKVFRFQVAYATARAQMYKLMHPHGVFIAYYNGRQIPDTVSESVMSFFFLFMASFVVLSILLRLTGMDTVSALSGAGSALSNVGPGLGEIIGPAGNYQSLDDIQKWLLAAGMLLGRLELFTVLVLFLPRVWRS